MSLELHLELLCIAYFRLNCQLHFFFLFTSDNQWIHLLFIDLTKNQDGNGRLLGWKWSIQVDTSVLNILCLFGADLGTGSNIIMPDKLPRGVKLLAVELDAKGWSQAEIASHLGISVDTITKAKRNMREYGDVERPEKKRGP